MKNRIILFCAILNFIINIHTGKAQYTITATPPPTETSSSGTEAVGTLGYCAPYTFSYSMQISESGSPTGYITINLPFGITFSSLDGVYPNITAPSSGTSSPTFTVTSLSNGNLGFSIIVETPDCLTGWASSPTATTIVGGSPTQTVTPYNAIGLATNGDDPPDLNLFETPGIYYGTYGVTSTNYSSCSEQDVIPGEECEVVVPINNDGGGISSLWLSYFNTSGTFTINGLTVNTSTVEVYPSTGSPSVGQVLSQNDIYSLTGNSVWSSSGGQPLYAHFGISVPGTCPEPGVDASIPLKLSYAFSPGCGTSTMCSVGATTTYTTSYNYDVGEPKVTAEPINHLQGLTLFDNCSGGTAIMGFVYNDDATDVSCAPQYNASAVINTILFNVNPNFGSISGTFTVTGTDGSFTTTASSFPFTDGGVTYYSYPIDFTSNTNSSLSNLPGDPYGTGIFNELLTGESFTVTTNFTYAHACPYSNALNQDYNLLWTDAKYDNELCTLGLTSEPVTSYTITQADLAPFEYAFDQGTATLMDLGEGAPNITQGGDGEPGPGFSLQVCMGNYQQLWAGNDASTSDFQFACPNADYQMVLQVPNNVEFDPTNSAIASSTVTCPLYVGAGCTCYNFVPASAPIAIISGTTYTLTTNPIIEDYTQYTASVTPCSSSTVVVDFQDLQTNRNAVYNGALNLDNIECFSVPLTVNCNACSGAPDGWVPYTYSFNYLCDPTACPTCANQLANAGTSLFVHCLGSCSNTTPGIGTDYQFYFNRSTLGWNYDNGGNDWDCQFDGSATLGNLLNNMTYSDPVDTLLTSPLISRDRVYPGDEIVERLNGQWNPTSPPTVLTNLYVETSWNSLVSSDAFCTDDILTLEPGIANSYAILDVPSVPLSAITVTVTAIFNGSITDIAGSQVGYDVYIDPTIFTSGWWATYSSDVIDFGVNLKWIVDPKVSCQSGNTPFPGGHWDLNDFMAEYIGSDVGGIEYPSCDPWANYFTIMQPSVSASFTWNDDQFYVPSYNPSYCQRIEPDYSLNIRPAYTDQKDFPNEFRPYAGWEGAINIIVPDAFSSTPCVGCGTDVASWADVEGGGAADNYILPLNMQAQFENTNTTISSVGSGTHNRFSINPSCAGATVWPLLDCNGHESWDSRSDVYESGLPECSSSDYTGVFWGGTATYQVSTQQAGSPLSYLVQTYTVAPQSFTITQTTPVIAISQPPTVPVNVFTDVAQFSMTLTNTSPAPAPDAWFVLQQPSNFWDFTSYTVTPSCPTYTFTSGGGTGLFVDYGYLATETSTVVTVDVPVNPAALSSYSVDCSTPGGEPVTIPISYQSGSTCLYQSITSPDASCTTSSLSSFNSVWYPSTLVWTPPSVTTNTISACPSEPFTYTFTLYNDDPGTTTNPVFWISLPPGLLLDYADFYYEAPLPGGGFCTCTSNSAAYTYLAPDYIWNLNSDAWLPSSCLVTAPGLLGDGTITATVVVQPDCSFLGGTFTAGAYANVSCENVLSTPTYSDVITATNTCMSLSTSQTNILCYGVPTGTATVNVTSGGSTPFTYSWSDGGTTSTITGLSDGTYTVVVSSGTSCAAASVIITQPLQLGVSPSITSVGCSGGGTGNIAANATGGTMPFTYLWSDGATTSTLTGVSEGTYTVTVTDNNGCSASGTVTLTFLNSSTTILMQVCYGESNGVISVNPSGGTPPFTYLWAPTGATTQTDNGLGAGTYTATVTDNSGCTAVATVILNATQILPNASIEQNISCNGFSNGEIVTAATGGAGGFTYSWDPGGSTNSGISGLSAGTYSVYVTDMNGCQVSSSITLTQADPLSATASITQPECTEYGTANINAIGGTSPFTYSWSTGFTTTSSTYSGLTGSTYTVTIYTVTIFDINGCTFSTTIPIVVPTQVSVISTVTDVSCTGSTSGSISAMGIQGTAPYSYSWSSGLGTNSSVLVSAAGTYTVTVTDANGCSATSASVISSLSISTNVATNIVCYGADAGTVMVNVSGGTPPFTYSWSPISSTNQYVFGLPAGTYTITVNDNNGCSESASVTLTQPAAPLTVTISPNPDGICAGEPTTLCASGATYYTWSDAETTSCITVTPPSNITYTVTGFNTTGCSSTASVDVNVGKVPPVPMISGPEYGCGGIYFVTNYNPGVTYTWTSLDASSGTTDGTYSGTWPSLTFDDGGTITFTDYYPSTPWCTSSATYTVQPCCNPETPYKTVLSGIIYASTLGSTTFGPAQSPMLIDGRFYVDTPTTFFGGIDVQFTANSKIEIIRNSTLYITGDCTHLHAACAAKGMWWGITINPGCLLEGNYEGGSPVIIEDADTAIFSINSTRSGGPQGVFDLYDFFFNKNYQDIIIQPTSATDVYNSYAAQCVFTCRDLTTIIPKCETGLWSKTLFNSIWLSPHTGERSHIGIQAKNVHSWANFTDDYFDYHDYGVYAYESNIATYGNYYQNITHITSSGTETGVFGYSSSYSLGNYTLKVGDVTSGNTFTNCYYGVRAAYLTGVQVENNIFNNINYPPFENAIEEARGGYFFGHSASLNIQANQIYNAYVGINVLNNVRIHHALINYNLIGTPDCTTPPATSINVSEVGSPPSAIYNIEDNSCYSQSFGITTNGLNSAIVDFNGVGLALGSIVCTDPALYNGAGIQSLDCIGNEICSNIVTAVDPSIVTNTYTAVLEAQNNGVVIQNNAITNANTQIQFYSTPISGDLLWLNQLNVGATGILATSIFLPMTLGASGNATENCFTGMTLNNTCLPNSSYYYYNTCSPLPTCNSLNYFPFNSILTHTCTVTPPPPPLIMVIALPYTTSSEQGNHFRHVLSDSLVLDSLRLDSLISDTLPVVMDSITSTVFKLIPDSMTVIQLENTARNEDFFSELQDTNSVLAKEGVVRTLWANPNLLNGNSIFQHFNDSISHASLGEILAIDTAIASNATSSNDAVLLTLLDSITPANNIEANLQTVAGLYLSFLINDTLSPSQLSVLTALAHKCPGWDGNGVYQARALLLNFDTVVIYDDSWCSGKSDNQRKPVKTTKQDLPLADSTAIKIYPNPNNGNFTLEYYIGNATAAYLTLYNTMGEEVGKYSLNGSQGKMSISNPELSNGIYIWKVYSEKEIIKFGKVIIIK